MVKKFLPVSILIVCLSLAACVERNSVSSMIPSPTQTQTPALTEQSAAPIVESSPMLHFGIPNLPAIASLTDDEINMLSGLRQIDGIPLYMMEYHGEYNKQAFDALNKAFDLAPACSTFAVNGLSDTIFARNHDFLDTPILLLYNKPTQGYASVSLVDLRHLGLGGAQNLTEWPPDKLSNLLYAPYIPVDGMNECGLAIGTMSVSAASHERKDAPKILYLEAFREILDHAKNTAEAIAILENYQIEFSALPSHFMIADKSGDMAVIEFIDGEMQVLRSAANWHAATNFNLHDSENMLNNFRNSGTKERNDLIDDNIWRYIAIEDTLMQSENGLDFSDAMSLLKTVSTLQLENVTHNTQWSVVYGLKSGRLELVVHMDYEHPVFFQFSKETGLIKTESAP